MNPIHRPTFTLAPGPEGPVAYAEAPDAVVRAAQYVRMSTDQQDFSIAYQTMLIAEYARERGLNVVKTYADEGVSGLEITRRVALQTLLADILSGAPGFDVLLIYDISRWGRFQNLDEAAHYEFVCRRAGVKVLYCAERFESDDSLTSSLLKHMRRAMAAEYSRDLSLRVRLAKCGRRRLGFWTAGRPGYGFRRAIVRRDGQVLAVRDAGEWQGYPNAYTRIVRGPDVEVRIVRRIFRAYLKIGKSMAAIAEGLNTDGVEAEAGGRWNAWRIRTILANPKYIGEPVFNRWRAPRLGARPSLRPEDEWEVACGGFPALVGRRVFAAVQARLGRDEALERELETLQELKTLRRRYGFLDPGLVDRETRFGRRVYVHRYGSLRKAFAAAGHCQPYVRAAGTHTVGRADNASLAALEAANPVVVATLRRLFRDHGRITRTLIDAAPDLPSWRKVAVMFGGLETVFRLAGQRPETSRVRLGPRTVRA